jgi:hypothetical protein
MSQITINLFILYLPSTSVFFLSPSQEHLAGWGNFTDSVGTSPSLSQSMTQDPTLVILLWILIGFNILLLGGMGFLLWKVHQCRSQLEVCVKF